MTSPLTPSACQAAYGTPCYTPVRCMLRKIYRVAGMRDQGQGADLALIMPYRNLVIVHDVDTYAPPSPERAPVSPPAGFRTPLATRDA